MAKFIDLIFIIFFSLGLFYTFTPYSLIINYTPTVIGKDVPHYYHIITGLLFLILALYTYKLKKQNHKF